jgi:SAM-dependent methyltransferase
VRRGNRYYRKRDIHSLPRDENDERWDQYTLGAVGDRHPLAFLTDRWTFEQPLYREIQRSVPTGGRILEVGSGSGANLLWLASRGYEVAGVEYRPRVVEFSQHLAASLELPLDIVVGDAFDLSAFRGFDLVFSVGMLEHWEYDRSVTALREQASSARTVVVVIPTPHTRLTGEITDERFYSRRELRNMLKRAGIAPQRIVGYGDVPGPIGRVSRSILPDIPYRLIAQRSLGWPCMALAAVGNSSP